MKFLAFLRDLFFSPKDTDSIVTPLTKTVKKLEKHAAKQVKKSARQAAAAVRLNQDATERVKDANRAETVKNKIGSLLS